ncbi:MAG: CBS domain-containing protein, partial [Bdellovibrionales bacterium]|nr:CBS domain-containing protein [Bdellovibrionales bacterium]
YSTTIGDVMTSHPVMVDIHDSVEVAAQLMAEHQIRHLPVISHGKPISVVSDREIQAAQCGMPSGQQLEVGDVCAIEGYMVSVSSPLIDVVKVMAEQKLGSVLVTDHDRIAGIFTAVDACRFFAILMEELSGCE